MQAIADQDRRDGNETVAEDMEALADEVQEEARAWAGRYSTAMLVERMIETGEAKNYEEANRLVDARRGRSE
jgi:hypothetical protein